MVIQTTMSPQAIVEVWELTIGIFRNHQIPLSTLPLEELAEGKQLHLLLKELNSAVGSFEATCIEGG
ncbi:hypothetical protein A8F94_13125 [Bacillus sp. FJAT-27225]|uniref:hypothetical protein n=1 Tax=Bacillus sp. FJAT-27225 TaxID=1743144 RepID=UPI00080C3343|nr:hypothetical protein [Bacillus sp. FJAT-27225]OCA85808.1 hypothetical protein A8F94_13125 [Bacillus sp. FJAT-27225]